jgi:hypothetical protein
MSSYACLTSTLTSFRRQLSMATLSSRLCSFSHLGKSQEMSKVDVHGFSGPFIMSRTRYSFPRHTALRKQILSTDVKLIFFTLTCEHFHFVVYYCLDLSTWKPSKKNYSYVSVYEYFAPTFLKINVKNDRLINFFA